MYIYILRACEENLCTTTLYVFVCMCVCIYIFTCSSLLRIDCEKYLQVLLRAVEDLHDFFQFSLQRGNFKCEHSIVRYATCP